MSKIGLYFGSFNPIHIGHMAIAGYMTQFGGIDHMWFVVSPHNPLKKKETLLADHQRLHMVRLAIGNNDRLQASDIEFKSSSTPMIYGLSSFLDPNSMILYSLIFSILARTFS